MKKIIYFTALFIALTAFTSCDDEKVIQDSQLPAKSKQFLNTHFSGVTISQVIKDRYEVDNKYNVYLSNGFEIDFTKSGDWNEIDGNHKDMPQSILDLLPVGILQYREQNFPDKEIIQINKERYGYEIGLSGDIDLEFNSNGDFIKFD